MNSEVSVRSAWHSSYSSHTPLIGGPPWIPQAVSYALVLARRSFHNHFLMASAHSLVKSFKCVQKGHSPVLSPFIYVLFMSTHNTYAPHLRSGKVFRIKSATSKVLPSSRVGQHCRAVQSSYADHTMSALSPPSPTSYGTDNIGRYRQRKKQENATYETSQPRFMKTPHYLYSSICVCVAIAISFTGSLSEQMVQRHNFKQVGIKLPLTRLIVKVDGKHVHRKQVAHKPHF